MLALRVTNCQLEAVNIPNLLTLSRIPIVFMIVGLLYLETVAGAATLALIIFFLGALTDWLDGYFARRMGLVSNFGKLMDALTDKIFITGTLISLLALNFIPVSWGIALFTVNYQPGIFNYGSALSGCKLWRYPCG